MAGEKKEHDLEICILSRVDFFHGVKGEYGITEKNGKKYMFTLAYGDETDTKR